MEANQRSNFRVFILLIVFFFVSLITNIIGPLIPAIIRTFDLSLTMAAFLPASFFVAYAVTSIPCGIWIERAGERIVMIAAFLFAFVGSLLFALMPVYSTAILSLFIIGIGSAALQVAANPLMRVAGGEENYAFNAVLTQIVFGLASFLSPIIYTEVTMTYGLPWVSVYWILAGASFAMTVMMIVVRFPRVERNEVERVGALRVHIELLRMPLVWLFFLAVFCYVGLEQGLSNWMSEYLVQTFAIDPQTDGATIVSRFWGLMIVGSIVGLACLKLIDSKRVLLIFASLAMVSLSLALTGDYAIARWGFPFMGFALSVMWSIIFSLALNSVSAHHGTFAGILCTAIVGGAVAPLIVGSIGDLWGLRSGLAVLYVPILYILSVVVWAQPLIKNKTIQVVNA